MAVTKKKGTIPDQHQLIVVTTKPALVETVDIGGWRTAINAARQGRPAAYYKLIENVMSDGILSMAIEKRLQAITNAELVFSDKDGNQVPEINELMDTPEFERLLREINLANTYGVSVIDILSVMPFDCFPVPRRNINVKKKLILAEEGDEAGLPYEGVPYIIEIKAEDPLGYIYKAIPYVIYKRGGLGDYAQLLELFGQPLWIGKYPGHDAETRDALTNFFANRGGAPHVVVPKEADIVPVENHSTANGDLHVKFLNFCDDQLLISVLGENMTTKDGSSRSQSEVHKEVEEDKNKSDRKFTRRILNRHIVPLLEAAGLPTNGGNFVFPEQGETLSTETRVNIAFKVKADGIPVSDEYIYEISGVRKPEEGETVSRNTRVIPEKEKPDPNNPDPDPKKQKAQAILLGKAFSFFAEALGKRAPLKF